uniref:Uncharacterized protein n=1 Tax=Arundo donax TaxID=35708 RepID=A0A0A9GU29_ARUDO
MRLERAAIGPVWNSLCLWILEDSA